MAAAAVILLVVKVSGDRMIEHGWEEAEKAPKRMVIEVDATSYRRLEQLGRGDPDHRSLSPPELVRAVVLGLTRERKL